MCFSVLSTCTSKLHERIEIIVYVPASFSEANFWVQQGSLLFDKKKTNRQTARQTNAKRALDPYQV